MARGPKNNLFWLSIVAEGSLMTNSEKIHFLKAQCSPLPPAWQENGIKETDGIGALITKGLC